MGNAGYWQMSRKIDKFLLDGYWTFWKLFGSAFFLIKHQILIIKIDFEYFEAKKQNLSLDVFWRKKMDKKYLPYGVSTIISKIFWRKNFFFILIFGTTFEHRNILTVLTTLFQCSDHKIDFWLQKNVFPEKDVLGWCEKIIFF